jgi:hypothetical protein
MNIKFCIVGLLLLESLFLFFTTKEEEKLKTLRFDYNKYDEVHVFTDNDPLGQRVSVDLNAETTSEEKEEYIEILEDCPTEFIFELYSSLEAPSSRKTWDFVINDGFFAYKNKKLTDIPISILEEPCFKSLDFSINRLAEFPNELEALSNLNSLNLSNNRIAEIEYIGRFKKLEYLDLSNNRIQKINEGIVSLKNIRHLNLKSNYKLSSISERIFELKNTLLVLNIKNTKLAKDKSFVRLLKDNLPNTKVIYK